jgi:hypothetical protein
MSHGFRGDNNANPSRAALCQNIKAKEVRLEGEIVGLPRTSKRSTQMSPQVRHHYAYPSKKLN